MLLTEPRQSDMLPDQSRRTDPTNGAGLRGRSGRLLASPLVAGAGDRSLFDPPDQHPGVTRTPTGEDRPTGYQPHDAGAARLAARRAKALQHGSDSNR